MATLEQRLKDALDAVAEMAIALEARIAALEGPPDLTPGFPASPTRTPLTAS